MMQMVKNKQINRQRYLNGFEHDGDERETKHYSLGGNSTKYTIFFFKTNAPSQCASSRSNGEIDEN